MSSRSVLFLAALAVLAALPAATAQTAHTLTIEIEDLPAMAESNGTALVVPFTVHATVSGMSPCVSSSGSTYTIALSAEVVNSTGNRTFATVSPKQYTIAGPLLVPTPGASGDKTQEAQLTVYPGPYADDGLNATIKVTASFTTANPGCTGGQSTPGAEDTADVAVGFTPVPALYGTTQDGQAMPGPGAVLVVAAIAAVALISRRK